MNGQVKVLLVASILGASLICGSAAASAAPPTSTLSAPAPSDVETTRAHLSGVVDPTDADTYYFFELTTEAPLWPGFQFEGFLPANSGPTPVTRDLTGLKAGTSYTARLTAWNIADPEVFSEERSFTTDPAPNAPTAVLDPAASVSYTSAKLSAHLDPEGGNEEDSGAFAPIHWALQTSPSGDPGSFGDLTSGDLTEDQRESSAAVDLGPADASNLAPGHTYHYRLLVTYAGQTLEPIPAGEFTTLPVAAPDAENLLVSNITATSAHFSATVLTSSPGGLDAGGQDAYRLHWSFAPGSSSGTTEAEAGTEAVSGEATGLEPNKEYTATLTAATAGGTKELTTNFTTEASKPDVSRETLWEPTSTSIQLNATVNTHNSPLTECRFEYGTTAAYGQSAACVPPTVDGVYTSFFTPPGDNSSHVVSARVSGLAPSTTYHFRMVASNGLDSAETADRSFTTIATPAPENCPNQARRDEQRSSQLPDCRAYKMVSPLAKGNGDIVGDGETTVSSEEGDAVAYNARTQFADAVGSGVSGQTQYLARRGPGGWSTKAITPMVRPDARQVFFAATKVQIFSEDLRSALALGYDLPGGGGTPERNGFFREDTATGALHPLTVSQQDKPSPFDFLDPPIWGLSADAHHLAFVSSSRYLPAVKQAQEPGGQQNAFSPNVYQSDDGVISLVSILPNGSFPPEGAIVLPPTSGPRSYRAAMSADGSRQLFTAAPKPFESPQLYQRIDGNRTVWISEPEGSDQSLPQSVILEGASADGKTVFFVSDSRLLDEDENNGPDLYLWRDNPDPETEDNLTLISHSGDASGNVSGGSLVGFSADAERIYYQTQSDKLVAWDHGGTRLIAPTVQRNAEPKAQLTVTVSRPGLGRTSPDGGYLTFLVSDAPDFVHGITGRITNGNFEMYVYDLANDTLRCVSCPGGPAGSSARVTAAGSFGDGTGPTEGNPYLDNFAFRPRFLSDKGELFFSTGEALVPEDTNGVYDAYAYDIASGKLGLLSTGKGKVPSAFTDASASGNDVFFVTRNRLTTGDTDELVDLYDARVGGGFTEPAVPSSPSCSGEGCQGDTSGSPQTASVASSVATRGNLAKHRSSCGKEKPRAARNRSAKRQGGKCKAHKRKKKDKQQRRSANANRGVAK